MAMVKMDTNQQNTMLIHSYLSEAGRQIEKDYAAGLYKDVEEGMIHWPYVAARYVNLNFDGDMTISKAYEWLKTLPEFKDAEDI